MTRAANDPSVFTIMEKAPTRQPQGKPVPYDHCDIQTSASYFHVYLLWVNNHSVLKLPVPSRGLLHDCENRLCNRWIVLQHYFKCSSNVSPLCKLVFSLTLPNWSPGAFATPPLLRPTYTGGWTSPPPHPCNQTSAVKRSIGSTIGFHNHGQGLY